MLSDIAPLGRHAGIAEKDLSDEQRNALLHLMGLRDAIPAPHRAWIESPGLVRCMGDLGAFLRNSQLTKRELELVILATAHGLNCPFVFTAHTRSGIRIGLDPSIPDAVAAGKTPALDDQREQLVFEVATALAASAAMPAALAEKAEAELGHPVIVELIALMGMYAAVCHTMKFYDVKPNPA